MSTPKKFESEYRFCFPFNYKKPAFWMIVVSFLLLIILVVCFITNPVQKEDLDDSKTDSALIPTYPPLPRVEYVSEESVIMIPTQAKLKGAHAGYLFIPIDGETYRYKSADGPISNTTASELFYEFSEDNEFGEHDEWKIYALRDYPNHERLLGKCNGMEDITAGMLSSSGGSVVHDVVFSEYEWK